MRIVPYDPMRPEHRAAFRDLNLAWIERWFVVEQRDRLELEDPERHILAAGGRILIAEENTPLGVDVLGTCALLAGHAGARELAKMAVKASHTGRGIGSALGEAALELARAEGASRVELMSNTKLEPAIALYRRLGFVEVPLPPNDYSRANIAMVLELNRHGRNGVRADRL